VNLLSARGLGLLSLLAIGLLACSATPRPLGGRCAGLPSIRFSEHLCAKIASGTKRITLRARHRHQILAGRWVVLRCMRSQRRFRAFLTGVRHTTWREITPTELADDGFSSAAEMLRALRRYYPGINWPDPATVYRWRDAEPCRRGR